jgi:hypothetical protein
MVRENAGRRSAGPLDEDRLVEAARHCDDCVCWLAHCEAECCRVFTFSITPRSDVVYSAQSVRIHTPLTAEAVRYYELHGAAVEADNDIVVVPRASCEVSSDRLEVFMQCSALRDDGLCGLHGEGQPEACSDFTWETASSGGWVVTPRCLFAYKARSGETPVDSQPGVQPGASELPR